MLFTYRALKTIIPAIFIITLLSFYVHPVLPQGYEVCLHRKITYDSSAFIVHYEDNFTFRYDFLKNREVKMFIPNNFADRLISFPETFSYSSKSNISVNFVYSTNESYFLILFPPSTSQSYEYYNLTIRYSISLLPSGSDFVVNNSIPVSFKTDFKVDLFSLEFFPGNDTFFIPPSGFNKVDGGWFHKSEILSKPMTFYSINVLQSFPVTQNFIFRSFSKEIQVNPILGIKVEDTYRLQVSSFLSSANYQSISLPPIYLPRWVESISAKDSIGPIEYSKNIVANTSLISLIAQSRFPLSPSLNYSLSVVYYIPFRNVSRVGDSLYFSVPLSTNVSQVIPSLSIMINLPLGASLKSLSINGTKLSFNKIESGIYEINLKNVPIGSSFSFLEIEIEYPLLWSGYPIGVSTLLVGLGLVLLMYFYKTKSEAPRELVVEKKLPPELERLKGILRTYIDNYLRIIELETEYFIGKTSKKDFRKLFNKVRSELDSQEREIFNSLSSIKKVHSEFITLCNNIETTLIELKSKESSIREMGTNYMNKRISREVFESYLEKNNKEIENLILKLRSEANL